jgi:hypothetical protein
MDAHEGHQAFLCGQARSYIVERWQSKVAPQFESSRLPEVTELDEVTEFVSG